MKLQKCSQCKKGAIFLSSANRCMVCEGYLKSMHDYQKKYFPSQVGKVCPSCGIDYKTIEKIKSERRGWKKEKKNNE